MTQHHAPLTRADWRRLFRTEMVWRRRVMAEVSSRERPPSTSAEKMRSVVKKGVLATFLRSGWSAERPAYVFVSFGKNPIVEQTRQHVQAPVLNPEGKGRDLLRGQSLIELDALYYLLHERHLFARPVRKWMIGRLMHGLTRQLPALQRQAFISHQDYFDKSSVLHTLAGLVPMQVLGLQHGLLRHAYLRSTPIFPGVRNHKHAVYSPLYGDMMRSRHPGAEVHVLGPPFEVGSKHTQPATNASSARPALLFISSDDLRVPERRQVIEALYKLCQDNGVDFKVRPHPQERDLMASIDLPFTIDSKDQVFSSDPRQQVFAGLFSTFLYEAAMRGFKTAWIASPGIQDAKADLPEAQDMPNATVLTAEDMDTAWLAGLFAQPLAPINTSPVGQRMAGVLKRAFPPMV